MTPKVRQTVYSLGTVASGIVTMLVTFRVLDPGTAAGVGNLIAAILGLFGTAATGTAAVVVAKQRREGTLDFSGTPAEQAISAIQATISQAATAQDELQKVKTAATEALTRIPAGSLVAQIIDTVK